MTATAQTLRQRLGSELLIKQSFTREDLASKLRVLFSGLPQLPIEPPFSDYDDERELKEEIFERIREVLPKGIHVGTPDSYHFHMFTKPDDVCNQAYCCSP